MTLLESIRLLALVTASCATLWAQEAASGSNSAPDFTGIYQTIGPTETAAGKTNQGSPEQAPLLPSAQSQAKLANLQEDPEKLCQPVGPFRMMARPENKIDVIPAGNMLLILFEDVAHGLIRKIDLNRKHVAPPEPSWLGDSVGHWEGSTLVVDTNGFGDRIWLNDKGVPVSSEFHIMERVRLVDGGKFLEFRVTAEDPKILQKPYSYVRYFRRVNAEIGEDISADQDTEKLPDFK